jgi:hypothetical protein
LYDEKMGVFKMSAKKISTLRQNRFVEKLPRGRGNFPGHRSERRKIKILQHS